MYKVHFVHNIIIHFEKNIGKVNNTRINDIRNTTDFPLH